MATSVGKKSKKATFLTIFSLVSALVPQILEAINAGHESVHVVIDNSQASSSIKASVVSVSADGVVGFGPEKSLNR